ncbi:MAG: hypothetical protein ABR568_07375 [Pyrinomonadaceae bacterium]
MLTVILMAFNLLLGYAFQGPQLVRESSHVAAASTGRFTAGDFARHVAQLKKRLPSNEFSIVVQAPFVVVGDEPRRDVQSAPKVPSNGQSTNSSRTSSPKTRT